MSNSKSYVAKVKNDRIEQYTDKNGVKMVDIRAHQKWRRNILIAP